MSDEEEGGSRGPAVVGQKRRGALQLGPRKKVYVCISACGHMEMTSDCHLAAGQTPSYTTADTLDARFMHFALSVHF
jgi:hypothetical protein